MAQTKITITTEDREAKKTYADLEQAQTKQEAGAEKMARTSQQTARQNAAAHEAAATKSVFAYNQILRELKKQGPEGRAQAKAIENHLRETGKAGRRSMGSIVEELDKLDETAGRVAREAAQDLQDAGDAGEDAFGPRMRDNLAQMATTYIGLQKAADLYRQIVEAARDAARESVETLAETTGGRQKLLQISGGDPAEFDRLVKKADELAVRYGILREEAQNLVFSSESEGFQDLTSFIAANAGNRLLSVDAQTTVAGQVPYLFRGEGIDAREAINATLTGAANSRLDFEGIARILPTVAAASSPTGGTFDESVASLSVMASEFATGEQAAQRIAALGARFGLDTEGERADTQREFKLRSAEDETYERNYGRQALAGLGLNQAVRVMLEEYTEEQRRSILGSSKELNEAFSAYAKNLDAIEARTAEIAASRSSSGTAESISARSIAVAEGRPEVQAIRQKIAAENELEIQREEKLAQQEANRQAEINRRGADALARDQSPALVAAQGLVAEVQEDATVASETAASAIGLDPYLGLATDARAASRTFADPESQRKLLAVQQAAAAIGTRRRDDPDAPAELTPEEVQNYLQTLSGVDVPAEAITPSLNQAVQRQIRSLAGISGARSQIFNALPLTSILGGNEPRQRAILEGATDPTVSGALLEALRENNELQREAIELQRQTADATTETATNTQPEPENTSGQVNRDARAAIPAPI